MWNKETRKILILTYYWPPAGGSGVQRWMYFAKYLGDFGYEPIVITVNTNQASYKNIDAGLLKQVENIRTVRTKTFELLKFYSVITTGNTKKGIPQGNVKNKGFFSKFSAFVRGNFFVPDARIGWNRYAYKAALAHIEKEDIKLVITTGPPQSTHLIGLKLKQTLGVKWLADFRDPWTGLYYNKDMQRMSWANHKDARLEKNVLKNAYRILTVGFKLKELLQNNLGASPDKFHHIYNGFDSEVMDNLRKKIMRSSEFEITFIGLLTDNQPYIAIIEALKIFMAKVDPANIKLCLAGNIQTEILESFKNSLPHLKIEIHGYIKHEKAMELMLKSDLLINVLADMANSEILISGKQMEYVATGNPILCIGNKNGESALILENIKNAYVLQKDEIMGIADAIEATYLAWKNGEGIQNNVTDEIIRQKSRYETTRQLGAYLDTIY
jgi:hypothetical protein